MPTFDIFASNASTPVAANPYTQLLLFHSAACMNGNPNSEPRDKAKLQEFLAKGQAGRDLGHFDLMTDLNIANVSDDAIRKLPTGAVLLRFEFTLAKRFLSRDDALFFPIENPLRRDHVFKVPMIPAATWKGSLRAAAVEQLILRSEVVQQARDRFALFELFGDEKSDDEDAPAGDTSSQHKLKHFLDKHAPDSKVTFQQMRAKRALSLRLRPDELHQQGRLLFFPSWFERTELDVLNPRNRKTRAGTLPINLEAVPAGKKAFFTLLYLPFDLLGNANQIAIAQRRDWKLIGEALSHMLLKSGFGAKKSSGCGRIRPKIAEFSLKCASQTFVEPEPLTDANRLGELGNAFAEATS